MMIRVYTDGATSGNPGTSGVGIFIKSNGNTYDYSIPLDGVFSNHEAEFHAVIHALEICSKNFPDEILSFHSDSKIVVDTILKDYTKNEQFRPLLEQIREQATHFTYFFIKWIPEKNNKRADQLAKQAIHM